MLSMLKSDGRLWPGTLPTVVDGDPTAPGEKEALTKVETYGSNAHQLLKKNVEHSATVNLFENYAYANKVPHWLALKKEQALVIKDCPKELGIEWKKVQHESACTFNPVPYQYGTYHTGSG